MAVLVRTTKKLINADPQRSPITANTTMINMLLVFRNPSSRPIEYKINVKIYTEKRQTWLTHVSTYRYMYTYIEYSHRHLYTGLHVVCVVYHLEHMVISIGRADFSVQTGIHRTKLHHVGKLKQLHTYLLLFSVF